MIQFNTKKESFIKNLRDHPKLRDIWAIFGKDDYHIEILECSELFYNKDTIQFHLNPYGIPNWETIREKYSETAPIQKLLLKGFTPTSKHYAEEIQYKRYVDHQKQLMLFIIP